MESFPLILTLSSLHAHLRSTSGDIQTANEKSLSLSFSPSLPCSDVTCVIMTGPVVLMSDWTSPAVQTRSTSMAGEGNQRWPNNSI